MNRTSSRMSLTPSERSGDGHAVLVDREQNLPEVREEVVYGVKYFLSVIIVS